MVLVAELGRRGRGAHTAVRAQLPSH
jgi:hypothetical protein